MAFSVLQIVQIRGGTLVPSPVSQHVFDMITYCTGKIKTTLYKDQTNEAIALMVLHYLTLEAMNDTSNPSGRGPITSEAEGGLKMSYGHAKFTSDNAALQSTGFGQELLALRRQYMPTFGTAAFIGGTQS